MLAILTLLLAWSAPAVAEAAEVSTLANGLRLVVEVDDRAPLAAVAVGYAAGHRDDPRAATGLARLTAAAMFSGGGGIGDGEHRLRVEALGGEARLLQDDDSTVFVTELPAEHVGLALWLEARRMAIIDAQHVERDRQRVASRSARHEDEDLFGLATTRVAALSLQPSTYARRPSDLVRLTSDDVLAFHRERFTPDAATIVVVGDVDPAAVQRAVEESFGPIERRATPRSEPTPLPQQSSRRTMTIRSGGVHQSALAYGWRCPGRADAVAHRIAAEAIALRLSTLLIDARHEATSVRAFGGERSAYDVVGVLVALPRGSDPIDLAPHVEREALRVVNQASDEEIEMAAKRLWLRELSASRALATRAAHLAAGRESSAVYAPPDAASIRAAAKTFTELSATLVEVEAAPVLAVP